jgi:hypothetical protein
MFVLITVYLGTGSYRILHEEYSTGRRKKNFFVAPIA